MKIAQVAPLIESVPPRLYGGTERIVSYLTEELVRLGHDVTLFASADSITSAELAPCCTRALRLDPTVRDIIPHFTLMIDKVRERAKEFDIFHFHIDFFHFPLFRSLAARTLTTLHGRQDLADLKPFYARFGEMPLVSISHDQRKSLPHANFVATIHHGIPADLHRPSFEQGRYLAFLGRISPEKRPDRAIRIARAAGIPLKIAAKVDKVDEEYFRNEILPLIDGPGVEFIGEINEREKAEILGRGSRPVVPGGLAGAIWAGDDRSHSVWHASACVPLRFDPRDHRGRRHRQNSLQRGRSRRGAAGDRTEWAQLCSCLCAPPDKSHFVVQALVRAWVRDHAHPLTPRCAPIARRRA